MKADSNNDGRISRKDILKVMQSEASGAGRQGRAAGQRWRGAQPQNDAGQDCAEWGCQPS